jgi:plasmid stabilization system protein ParE
MREDAQQEGGIMDSNRVDNTAKYKVEVTEPAENMLLEHAEFLAQASLNAADRMLSKFDLILARIADNPLQFPFADELDAPDLPPNAYRKCLFEGRYKALFRLEENEAHVIAVIDSRMGNRGI